MPNRASKRFRVIFMLLTALSILFAFVHSLMPSSVSDAESNGFVLLLQSFFQLFGVTPEAVPGVVRKRAHYTEFSVIGAMLTCCAYSFDRIKPYRFRIQILFVGLLTAVTDETIQIFSGRGSQVQDVVLDFSGALTGILLVSLIMIIAWRNQSRIRLISLPNDKLDSE